MSPLQIPDPSLILLIGPSGAGKSTFAARNFKPTEIVSSDRLRAVISDDEADQNVNPEVFSLLSRIARARLAHGRLTVIDATNLETSSRQRLLRIARDLGTPAVAITFDVGLEACLRRNLARPHRVVNEEVIRRQAALFQRALARLNREGYASAYALNEANLNDAVIERVRIDPAASH